MRKAALFIVVMLGVALWTYGAELPDRGYRVLSQSEDDGLRLFETRSPQGNRLTVGRAGDTFTERQLDNLETLHQTLFGFSTIRISDLKILFYEDRTEILLIPERISYDGENLAEYVPSGIQFYLREALQYDFRMVVEEYFVRVRGEFFSEDQLLERMREAVANPVAFVQSTDPRYLFERLQELQNDIDATGQESQEADGELERSLTAEIRDRFEQAQDELRDAVESLEDLRSDYEELRASHETLVGRHDDLLGRYEDLVTRHEELTSRHEELASRHEDLESRHGELRASHEELQGRHQDLAGRHDDLRGRHEALREEGLALENDFAEARYGIMILNNRGWFGRIDLPDREMIADVVAMKEDDPDLTVDEVTDIMQERYPEADVDKNEIFLVFVMYFNETE